jgi:POT family proton-dependent oligopeptide transporter
MVALFFLSVAIGSAASGSLAQLTDVDNPSSTGTYFLILGIVTMVLSLVFFLLRRWIDKKMVGIH